MFHRIKLLSLGACSGPTREKKPATPALNYRSGGRMRRRSSGPLVLSIIVAAREVLQELLIWATAEGLASDTESSEGGEENLEDDHPRVVTEAIHFRASGARHPILEEHGNDGKHCQPAAGDLCVQLLGTDLRVLDGSEGTKGAQEPQAEIARLILVGLASTQELKSFQLKETRKEENLGPASNRDLGQSSKAVRHILKPDALGRAQFTWEPVVLRHNVANDCQHRHAPMLDFHFTAPFELGLVAILAKTSGVPEVQRGLRAKLRFRIERI